MGSGIAHERPLWRQVWICDDLSWWLIMIQENPPGIVLTSQPRPKALFPGFGGGAGKSPPPPTSKAREKRPSFQVAHSPTLYARGFKGT